jgi:hypothetical protein
MRRSSGIIILEVLAAENIELDNMNRAITQTIAGSHSLQAAFDDTATEAFS